ncbi:MAG: hypothetical protein R6V73_06320 [Anaerolineales bacterium]
MPVLTDLQLQLSVDQILKNEGIDPDIARGKNPAIVSFAERALQAGLPLIEPVVAYRSLKVKSVKHERVILEDGGLLAGKLAALHLGPAQRAVVMICTIGGALESYASAVLPNDPAYGFALDALGTAAVEALTVAACRYFGDLGAAEGMQATLPISPGMEGWSTARGQAQIFALVEPQEAGVNVTSSGMMVPQKSLAFVIGLGQEVENNGRICDYCSLRWSCRYQDQYA